MRENEERKTNTGTHGTKRRRMVWDADVVVTLILWMSRESMAAAWQNGLMSPEAGLAPDGF